MPSAWEMDNSPHDEGARDCPNYYNADRKLSLISSSRKFCKDCLEKLQKKGWWKSEKTGRLRSRLSFNTLPSRDGGGADFHHGLLRY